MKKNVGNVEAPETENMEKTGMEHRDMNVWIVERLSPTKSGFILIS